MACRVQRDSSLAEMVKKAFPFLLLVLLSPQMAACRGHVREGPVGAAFDWEASFRSDSAFGALVARLSEPGGYFDTDNLISNERSYLHVVGALRRLGVQGGAYLGVGPDQNFSYMAAVRPRIAFLVDIRRDNLLEHLMFKALLGASRNRIEYLCLLVGRRCPVDTASWTARPVEELVDYIDGVGEDAGATPAARKVVLGRVESFGIPLTEEDVATVARFHDTFIREGLDLRFTSYGRSPRFYYPTYRQLLLETDLEGERASYLAREEDFQFVKSLSDRNLIVPVVGDLGGSRAVAEIGRTLAERSEVVSAFYTSNVEFYLMRQGGFGTFANNVATLPHDSRSVIIRSYFGRFFGLPSPQQVPGYASVQLLQPIESLLEAYGAGRIRSYFDLVTQGSLDLAPAAGDVH